METTYAFVAAALLLGSVSAAPIAPVLFVNATANETAAPVETVARREYTYYGPQLDTAKNQVSEVCARAFASAPPTAPDRISIDLNKCRSDPGVPPYSRPYMEQAFLKGSQIWVHHWSEGGAHCELNEAHEDIFISNLNACTADRVDPEPECDCNDIKGYLKAFPSNPCGAVYKIDKKHPYDPQGKCKCGSINGKRCGKITASWWGKNPPKTPL